MLLLPLSECLRDGGQGDSEPGEEAGEVGVTGTLLCQRAGTDVAGFSAGPREGGSALTTVAFGWLLDGKVLWWKVPGLGGEVISQIPPDA